MSAPLVTRRNALKALGATAGAATLLPWLSDEGLAAFAEAQKANAAPVLKVLTPAQYVTVEHLVEAIIPTDARSPGAKDARVADYMDLLLAEADEGLRKDWLAGLAALDAESSKRFGRGFAKLDPAQTDALLSDISKYETAKSVADPALQVPRNEEPKPLPPQVDTLLGEVGRHPQGAAVQGQQGPARVRGLPDGRRQGLPLLRAESGGLKWRPRTRPSTSTSSRSRTSRASWRPRSSLPPDRGT